MREEEGSQALDRLWKAYRRATPEPEVSPNFMPELWARIEAARPVSWVEPLRRLAARSLPLAAALTLAMGIYFWNPRPNPGGDPALVSYVDVLAADLIEQQRPALWVAEGEDSI